MCLTAAPVAAQSLRIDGVLPGGVAIEVKREGGRPRVSVDVMGELRRRVRARLPEPVRKASRRRGPARPAPRPVPTRAPAPARVPPPVVAEAPIGADHACLADLRARGVSFVTSGSVRGITTPITITGPIGGVRLAPRGGRPPLMDCELARALDAAAPIFTRNGVSALSYSGTYVYRNVSGTTRLSGHAHGLAIDVHAFETSIGHLDVLRDYARDGGRWKGEGRGAVAACIGHPASAAGRVLRALACELRAHPAFRHIITPDDNAAHHNHLHLETHPAGAGDLVSSGASARSRFGRRGRR